jgi:hypothetical protein
LFLLPDQLVAAVECWLGLVTSHFLFFHRSLIHRSRRERSQTANVQVPRIQPSSKLNWFHLITTLKLKHK